MLIYSMSMTDKVSALLEPTFWCRTQTAVLVNKTRKVHSRKLKLGDVTEGYFKWGWSGKASLRRWPFS